MKFFEEGLPIRARVYLLIVTALGGLTLAWSLWVSLQAESLAWLSWALIALVSGLFPVKLPSVRAGGKTITLTVSDVLIFSVLFVYSPEVAVSVAFVDGLAANLRTNRPRRPYRIFFNLAQLAFTTLLVGWLFYWWMGQQPPLQFTEGEGVLPLLLSAAGCGLLYFALNSSLVAVALKLITGEPIALVLSENFLWASLTTLAGAAGASFIVLIFPGAPLLGLALVLPLVLVAIHLYRLHVRRIEMVQCHLDELDNLYHATITSLAMAIDAKEQDNFGNIQRVQAMTMALAEKLDIRDERMLKGLRAASLLHDIGKLAVPEYILNKPGKLTESEAEKVRNHPRIGAEILETVPFPYPVVPYVKHHHERWDGGGYPSGLKGEEIPFGARILAVVDCYFGLRSDRPFRPRLSRELAVDLMRQESGRAFDPRIIRVMLENLSQLEAVVEEVEPGSGQIEMSEHVQDSLQPAVPVLSRKIEGTVFHDIASTHEEMRAVYEISQNLGRSLNVEETLSYLSSRIRRFVPFSSCVVYLANSEDSRLLSHHAAGMYSDILSGVELRMGEGLTGWVAAHNEALINVPPDADFPNLSVLQSVFKSSLVVPLALKESVVGVISLYCDAPDRYLEQHMRVLQAIAPHAGAALSNSIIYQEMQEDAYTDALTGLPNIRYHNVYVKEELKRAKVLGQPVTFLMMDLDGFKLVNDRFGHQRGDLLLIEVARLLRSLLRKSDTCLRYGGDEFLAVLPGMDRALAQQTILRIQEAFEQRALLQLEGDDVRVGISVGMATYPEDGIQIDELVRTADREMFRNKSQRHRSSNLVPFEKPGS